MPADLDFNKTCSKLNHLLPFARASARRMMWQLPFWEISDPEDKIRHCTNINNVVKQGQAAIFLH